eukprot:TRINITY_DN6220_c0_g1_i1.p1 TRINITY_DN6220_c0_g1~~TRINITY_DN6220_c0_g1_i1.p1  ORF type:complete len:538 (-),score=92.10 TRINITY_DN6220_c0_g1_i1:298-1911(-)
MDRHVHGELLRAAVSSASCVNVDRQVHGELSKLSCISDKQLRQISQWRSDDSKMSVVNQQAGTMLPIDGSVAHKSREAMMQTEKEIRELRLARHVQHIAAMEEEMNKARVAGECCFVAQRGKYADVHCPQQAVKGGFFCGKHQYILKEQPERYDKVAHWISEEQTLIRVAEERWVSESSFTSDASTTPISPWRSDDSRMSEVVNQQAGTMLPIDGSPLVINGVVRTQAKKILGENESSPSRFASSPSTALVVKKKVKPRADNVLALNAVEHTRSLIDRKAMMQTEKEIRELRLARHVQHIAAMEEEMNKARVAGECCFVAQRGKYADVHCPQQAVKGGFFCGKHQYILKEQPERYDKVAHWISEEQTLIRVANETWVSESSFTSDASTGDIEYASNSKEEGDTSPEFYFSTLVNEASSAISTTTEASAAISTTTESSTAMSSTTTESSTAMSSTTTERPAPTDGKIYTSAPVAMDAEDDDDAFAERELAKMRWVAGPSPSDISCTASASEGIVGQKRVQDEVTGAVTHSQGKRRRKC